MKPAIIEIADSLNKKQREKFLELTEKVNLLNPTTYNHLNLKEYLPLLKQINDLYDGKVDYITEAISRISGEHWKKKTEQLVSEFVKI